MHEHKALGAHTKQVHEDGTFSAIVATIGIRDHDDDVLVPGVLHGQTAPILVAHNQGERALGKAMIEERGDLAVAVGELNLNIPAARDLLSWLRFDLDPANGEPVQQWSWGFLPVQSRKGKLDGAPVRFLERVDLVEISPVIRGASVGTMTTCAGDSCRMPKSLARGTRSKAAKSCCDSCTSGDKCEDDLVQEWSAEMATRHKALRDKIDAEIADEYGWVRAWATPAPMTLQRIVDQVAQRYKVGKRGIADKPGAFTYREVGTKDRHNLWVKRGCAGICFPHGDRPLVGINEEVGFTRQSLLWAIGHELGHAAGHDGSPEGEEACNGFGDRVVDEMLRQVAA